MHNLGDRGSGGMCSRGGGVYEGPVLTLTTMAPGYTLVSQAAPLFNPAVNVSACPDEPAG